jgi:hypothetical protein
MDYWYKFYVLFGVFDKPARAEMLFMKQSTGYYGCLKCEEMGQSIIFANGHHVVFPYSIKYTLLYKQKRTLILYEEALKNKDKGVLGESVLNKLEYYCPVLNTLIDVMHSIFLGGIKLFFKYWFEYSQLNSFSFKLNLSELNARIKLIRPPQFITQAPRNLQDFNNWRAHEFMNFILFFAIPVFYKIIPEIYFENLLLLVIVLENVFSKSVLKSDLFLLKKMIHEFLFELDDLYDEHIYSSGIHELSHLVSSILESGPPNAINLMQFEELNRTVTRSINGQDLVGDEYIRNVNIAKNLIYHINSSPEFLAQSADYEILSFINKYAHIKSSNLKRNHTCNQVILGRIFKSDLYEANIYEKTFLNNFLSENDNFDFYERLKFNNIIYTNGKKMSRFNNSVILSGEKVGIICHILKKNDLIYFICRQLVFLSNPFFHPNFPSLKSKYSYYRLSFTYFSVDQNNFSNLKKLFLFQIEDKYLVTKFTSGQLFT